MYVCVCVCIHTYGCVYLYICLRLCSNPLFRNSDGQTRWRRSTNRDRLVVCRTHAQFYSSSVSSTLSSTLPTFGWHHAPQSRGGEMSLR